MTDEIEGVSKLLVCWVDCSTLLVVTVSNVIEGFIIIIMPQLFVITVPPVEEKEETEAKEDFMLKTRDWAVTVS